jgi:hypothetical protein
MWVCRVTSTWCPPGRVDWVAGQRDPIPRTAQALATRHVRPPNSVQWMFMQGDLRALCGLILLSVRPQPTQMAVSGRECYHHRQSRLCARRRVPAAGWALFPTES